jgi:hypothetical protein
MADRELIAAILTAGMLPTLDVPQSRVRAGNGPVTRAERELIQSAVDHAFGLYRLVLNGLGVDPLATMAEPDTETRPPAVAMRNWVADLPVDDTARGDIHPVKTGDTDLVPDGLIAMRPVISPP